MEKKRSATASGEDYLEAVLVLQKEKGMVRSVDVARHMGVSKPSVCHAVVTLKKGGFLTMDEDLFLRLTDIGREVAEQTYPSADGGWRGARNSGTGSLPNRACDQRGQFSEIGQPVSEETFKCKVNRGRGGNLMWKQVLLIDDGLL